MKKKEDAKHNAGVVRDKHSLLQSVAFTVLWLLAIVLFYSLLVHFTHLRSRVPIDPIGAVISRVNPPERAFNIQQANYHIGETERLVAETQQQGGGSSGGHNSSHARTYETMIWHNDEATKYMLAAEAKGVDLKKEGLIKRLCDSLKAQYVLMTGKDPDSINDSETLNARVNNGEDLQTVFNQIQEQLKFAMSW